MLFSGLVFIRICDYLLVRILKKILYIFDKFVRRLLLISFSFPFSCRSITTALYHDSSSLYWCMDWANKWAYFLSTCFPASFQIPIVYHPVLELHIVMDRDYSVCCYFWCCTVISWHIYEGLKFEECGSS